MFIRVFQFLHRYCHVWMIFVHCVHKQFSPMFMHFALRSLCHTNPDLSQHIKSLRISHIPHMQTERSRVHSRLHMLRDCYTVHSLSMLSFSHVCTYCNAFSVYIDSIFTLFSPPYTFYVLHLQSTRKRNHFNKFILCVCCALLFNIFKARSWQCAKEKAVQWAMCSLPSRNIRQHLQRV